MIHYERRDRYYKMAKVEGRASRASYKIEEINKRFHLIKKGDCIIDLGCAPGGWLQVLASLTGSKGIVVGVDTQPLSINIVPPISFIQGDIFEEDIIERIKAVIPEKCDLLVSDLAPHMSGIKFRDSYLSFELAKRALEIADELLKEGGNFVAKIFPGMEQQEFQRGLKRLFKRVNQFVPEATRKTSSEFYLICLDYKPPR